MISLKNEKHLSPESAIIFDKCLDAICLIKKERDRAIEAIAEVVYDCDGCPTKFSDYHLSKLIIILFAYTKTHGKKDD